jgi:hypothetical protein
MDVIRTRRKEVPLQADIASNGGSTFNGSPIAVTVLGALSAVVVVAALTNSSLPFLGVGRGPLIALTVLGLTMCALAGGFYTQLGVAHPATIAGMILGLAAAAIVVSAFAGWTGILQPVADALGGSAAGVTMDRAAIVALGGVMAVKWVIGWVLYLPR